MLSAAVVALALAVPPGIPEVTEHAVAVQMTNELGEASFIVPLSELGFQRVGRAIYELPGMTAFPTIDGDHLIAAIDQLKVEYVSDTTIRLDFSVLAGDADTSFVISTGQLRRPGGTPYALTRASMLYKDANLNGGGVTGNFRPPLLPVDTRYAYRATYNQAALPSNTFALLIQPFAPELGNAVRVQEVFPGDNGLARFFVPVNQFGSSFNFTLSGRDQAQGSSVYYLTSVGRCGLADIATVGGADLPDAQLTPDDLIVYLNAFFEGNTAVADVASPGGSLFTDGELTADDIIAFLTAFFAGCGQ